MYPPRKAIAFLRWFCREECIEEIEGDLTEVFRKHHAVSPRFAKWKFVWNVMRYFRPEFIKSFRHSPHVNSYGMYKSYLKIGWRNFIGNKGYSLINVGGLATGISVVILIGLWIYDEVSYDKNFPNYNRIARVVQNQTINGEIQTWFSQAMQLGPELQTAYGNNFEHVITASFPEDIKLSVGTKSLVKTGSYMEPGVTDMLTLNITRGAHNGLVSLNSILLSQSTAKALFGYDDPIDKLIRVNNNLDVKVTGVYEDFPRNSSFSNLEVIMPWQLLVKSAELEKRVSWGNSWFQCFVQIAEKADMKSVSLAIKDAKLKRVLAQDNNNARFRPELFLHPMSRWRLHSEFENGVSVGGGIKNVRMLGAIGGVVLLLACINFMNLSTARSEKRAKEVGIRKSVGSARSHLISQFFTESLIVALISFVLSILIVLIALPWFNGVSGKRLGILWTTPAFWLASTGFVVVTGLVAGSYPALFLSSFQPIKVLKGTLSVGRFSSIPRKVLVVVQFTVSVTLIISTIVIFRQIRFAQNRPLGYAINGCITVPIKSREMMKHYDALRDELTKTGAVEEMAASESAITDTYVTNSGFDWTGKEPDNVEEFVTVGVTHDFGKVIGWQIIEGKDFSSEIASDSVAFIINEAAAKLIGMKNPVGEVIKWNNNGEWKIIGVVKDMVTQSPYAYIKPMLFFIKSSKVPFINFNVIEIKLNPSVDAEESMAKIASVFKKYDPDNAFEYRFADEEFGKKFNEEKRIGNLAFVFTVIAIFISCLGLFGLASFVAEQRTKEIGIRKVIGASVVELWKMLSADFIILVVIASVAAIPIAYYLMERWLRGYEYRTEISWWIFVVTSASAVLITLMTVSFQAIKAARMNPTKSLRSE